jgi:hypothetical protein
MKIKWEVSWMRTLETFDKETPTKFYHHTIQINNEKKLTAFLKDLKGDVHNGDIEIWKMELME